MLYGLGRSAVLAAGAVPVLVEGPLDALAIATVGACRYVGVAPSGTALTSAQVAVLDRAVGSLAERGVVVAFDADGAGRDARLRAYDLLRTAGTWPSTIDLPDGDDPASLAQQHGPEALLRVLDANRPLADLVIDEHLDRWASKLQWPEGILGAARDAAVVIATLPAEHVARQVLRVAERLGLATADVTDEVIGAVTSETLSSTGRVLRASSVALKQLGPVQCHGLRGTSLPRSTHSIGPDRFRRNTGSRLCAGRMANCVTVLSGVRLG